MNMPSPLEHDDTLYGFWFGKALTFASDYFARKEHKNASHPESLYRHFAEMSKLTPFMVSPITSRNAALPIQEAFGYRLYVWQACRDVVLLKGSCVGPALAPLLMLKDQTILEVGKLLLVLLEKSTHWIKKREKALELDTDIRQEFGFCPNIYERFKADDEASGYPEFQVLTTLLPLLLKAVESCQDEHGKLKKAANEELAAFLKEHLQPFSLS